MLGGCIAILIEQKFEDYFHRSLQSCLMILGYFCFQLHQEVQDKFQPPKSDLHFHQVSHFSSNWFLVWLVCCHLRVPTFCIGQRNFYPEHQICCMEFLYHFRYEFSLSFAWVLQKPKFHHLYLRLFCKLAFLFLLISGNKQVIGPIFLRRYPWFTSALQGNVQQISYRREDSIVYTQFELEYLFLEYSIVSCTDEMSLHMNHRQSVFSHMICLLQLLCRVCLTQLTLCR